MKGIVYRKENPHIKALSDLRDQMAMAALQGLLAGMNNNGHRDITYLVGEAYHFANAMMEARKCKE